MPRVISLDDVDGLSRSAPLPVGAPSATVPTRGRVISLEDADRLGEPPTPSLLERARGLLPTMPTLANGGPNAVDPDGFGSSPDHPFTTAAAPDPELERFYSETSRLGRILGPLEAGARQAQQIGPAIEANVAGRFGALHDQARGTTPMQSRQSVLLSPSPLALDGGDTLRADDMVRPPQQMAALFPEDPRLDDLYGEGVKRLNPQSLNALVAQSRDPRFAELARREIERRNSGGLAISRNDARPKMATPRPPAGWEDDAPPATNSMPALTDERVGTTPEGRPIMRNADGSVSTERSITVEIPEINGGKPTNIPTMFGGREVQPDEAIRKIIEAGGRDPETGRVLPGYASNEEAENAARGRSQAIGATVNAPLPSFGGTRLSPADVRRLPSASGSQATPGDYMNGELRGGLIDAMRRQTPEEAEETRRNVGGLMGRAVSDIAKRQGQIEELPQNPATAGMLNARTWGEAGQQFWRDPLGVIQSIALQSAPSTAPGLVAGIVGGPAAGAGAMGVSSALQEYTSTILQEIARAGVDIRDPDKLTAAFSDQTLMDAIRQRAAVRAGIIGSMDAATMGLASKTLAPRFITGHFGREAANIPAQMAAQGFAGGGAEAAAQLATEGRITEPGQILAEVVGEAASAPAEVGSLAARRFAVRNDNSRPQATAPAPQRAEPAPAPLDIGETVLPPSRGPDVPSANLPPARPAEPGVAGPTEPRLGTTLQYAPAFTPSGRRIDTVPEVVELSSLTPSHTDDLAVNPAFPADLQPRDRGRAASQAQIAEIAGGLQPERLGIESSVSEGAPIVGADGVVESGNARTLALRQAYGQNLPGAQAYRQWLQRQGFNVEGMQAPVLVRRRVSYLSPEDRVAFTREANERATLAMGTTEQAAADARALTPAALSGLKGGDLLSAENRGFVRSFLGDTTSPAERGALVTPQGQLSQEGVRRIQAALFQRAYEAPHLLATLREGTTPNVKAIGEAMVNAAGEVAKLRDEIRAGRIRPEVDPSAALVEAASIVKRARDMGTTPSALMSQGDMMAGGANPATRAAMRLFFRDDALTQARNSRAIAAALRFYTDQASQSQAGPALLGDALPSAVDLFNLARQREEGGLLPEAADMRAAGDLPATSFSRGVNGSRIVPFDQVDSLRPAASAAPKANDELPGTANAMAPGATYKGFISTVFNPAATRRSEPIRRERILANMLKKLDAAIYQGRVRGKSVLGFYRKRIEEIRIKRYGDLETATHEIAHMLDDRFPEIRKQWTPGNAGNKAIRDELAGVSYDKSKLYEGFAEFVRLWSTQGPEAQARAPLFSKWFEGWLQTQAPKQVSEALRETRKAAHEWFAQHALDRAQSKIGDAGDINEALSPFWKEFRQSTLDDLEGIKQMEIGTAGGIRPGGAYETARLSRGAGAMVVGSMLYGHPVIKADGSHSFAGKGLMQILNEVPGKLNDMLLYFVGRSANELMMQGRERLFSKDEIAAMRSLETPERKKAFEEYQEWNKGVLDFAEAKGIINPESRAQWKRAEYLPFHRVTDRGTTRTNTVTPGDWKGIKALTGGTSNIRDVLGNMVGNARMLIEAAWANDARREVAKLANMSQGAKFMAKIPTDTKKVSVATDEIEAAILKALGLSKRNLPVDIQVIIDQIKDQMGPVADFWLRGQKPHGHNVVAVLNSGKPTWYEVIDPILYRSLQRLSRPTKGLVTRILGVARNLAQKTITLTPDFMAANFVRDQLTAGIMSKTGYKPFYDGLRGLKSRLASDQNYRDFVANGGGMSSHLLDEKQIRGKLERLYRQRGINPQTVMNTAKGTLDAVTTAAEAFEVATRLSEFRRNVEAGDNPRHAAYLAREVSTDYAMRGDNAAVEFLYDTVIFLKAAVNSLDRLGRALNDRDRVKLLGAPMQARARVAALTSLVGLASMGLYGLNAGNPLYEDLEDWDKDSHWHFFIPKPSTLEAWNRGEDLPLNERYMHFRLPKIWEIGMIGTLAERALESGLNGIDADKFKAMLAAVGRSFSFEYMPQMFEPVYELLLNRDRFSDRPIESETLQNLQPWARSNVTTSQTMRALGEATRNLPTDFQFSPVQAEHLLRGYLNTWAAYGLAATDAAFFGNTKPDSRPDQYPVARRFYSGTPQMHSRHVTELYDAVQEALQARNTMRLMDRTGRTDIASEIETTPENLSYRQLNKARETMSVFKRESDFVHNERSLEALQQFARERFRDNPSTVGNMQMRKQWDDLGALKRALLDDLVTERNAFAKDVMGDVRKRKTEARQPTPAVQ